MIGAPSQVAGNPERVIISPPNKEGKIHPAILFTAKFLEIKEVYKAGGAQGIAALAYGTKTIPKVYKIFGPGNAFVTEAKQQVSLDPFGAAIDMPAGPSEVLVIADESCNPAFVASDLLSQAEHDPRSQVLCIVTRRDIGDKINLEVSKQIENLPRKEIALKSLENSTILSVNSVKEAIEISNEYAPEHLILQIKKPKELIKKIRNTGSVFVGPWTPESLGDYSSGTNHVLPTYGYAKAYSGLGVEHFMRSFSIQEATKAGLNKIAETVETLAAAEGLDAHKNAVRIRRNYKTS
jgi:histidinol dehydrogenase